jgi:hypothetical protein
MSVKTRGKTWSSLADELWRYVLFSEFVFDLPVALPETLKGVPHAPMEARPIVEDVCDRCAVTRSHAGYIERAESIEAELNLADLCGALTTWASATPSHSRSGPSCARPSRAFLPAIPMPRSFRPVSPKSSVWLGKGESQAQWELVRAGLSLVEACEDFERQLPDHARSQADLLDFYLGSLREADRLQREFEQAAGDFLDPHGLMHEVIQQARDRYRRLAEKVQGVFVKYVETAGWPPTDAWPTPMRLIAWWQIG